MKYSNELLEKLSSSSLRLCLGLIVLGALVALLLGTTYLGIQRTIEEQRDTMLFHFARLMENIREQEAFLMAVHWQSTQGDLQPLLELPQPLPKPLTEEGLNVYEGREFQFSQPYSVKINPNKIASSQHAKVFAISAHLAVYYSAFWSASHYQSPQVFLFNGLDNFDVSVPATGRLHREEQIQRRAFPEVVSQIQAELHSSRQQPLDNQVQWKSYLTGSDLTSPALLAYIAIDLPPGHLDIPGASSRVVLASLLSLSQVNNIERMMQWTTYDQFTLIAPSGIVLAGAHNPKERLNEGMNFNRDGLVFKLTSSGERQWTAIYVISFKSFVDYVYEPLLFLLALMVLGLGCGWVFNRWYKHKVVLPANRAHERVYESEAFSRAVIDTAPTGLCVVRQSDHKVLLQNQSAQQFRDISLLMSAIDQHPGLKNRGQADLEIDGRHVQVAFVHTRYQGQDAWLCAFHDVTRHIEDAAALEAARQVSDSANEAKSRFLATMSHEIRTPLYGVLGTLELLALTTLNPRQRDYLDTIQRSSATLFQLISDVLDVSKIESGQMTLETQDFCPLELTEDTLRAYNAFAQAKGLQIYACIDAQLPNRVRGDPLRIRQILNNLLSNAIKFTDNGQVVLRARVFDTDGENVSLHWQVSDSGIGISQIQQAQLFDPFYQVNDAISQSGAGAGLGLAICKWLCELMNGQLNVVSELGLGSSFTLQLNLERVPGELSDCPPFEPGEQVVYVQAQISERAQHFCAWLNRLGLEARVANTEMPPPLTSTVLVDLLPPSKERPWPGLRVGVTSGGRNPPEYSDAGWEVDANDVRAVAWAIYLAQRGATHRNLPLLPEKAGQLNLSILVAEDNLINAAIIKEQLEALGCSVVVAANGEKALSQWLPGRFDLVLTDVNMPVMNGYDFAEALRRQDADIPIIGVTANALREEGQRCAAVGMSAWLIKPLNLHTLRVQLLKYCKLASNVTETEKGIAQEVKVDHIQLSPRMRELFVSTLEHDIQITLAALESGDANAAAQQLHSMAGALGAVQAGALALAFVDLECRLVTFAITPALALEVRQQLQCLSALLDALE